MISVPISRVSPHLQSLFDWNDPAGMRCFAVLDGVMDGEIMADDLQQPTWSVVRETIYGTTYLGGAPDPARLSALVNELRHTGDVLIGLWPDDHRLQHLPDDPQYTGAAVDFTDRPPGEGLERFLRQVPAECEVRQVDRALLERCEERDAQIAAFGSVEKAIEQGLGFCLIRGEEILCEAFAGTAVRGWVEVGVATRKPYEGHGFATLTSAHLIQACEARGDQTYWNCAAQNGASLAIARKLGYRNEKAYTLLAWFKAA